MLPLPARPCRTALPLAACLLVAAGSAPASATEAMAPADSALAAQVLAEANRYRLARALPPLQADAQLAALAEEHSWRMARETGLSHAGFHARFERARRQTCVENLAAGFGHAAPLVAGWQASGSHHANLLDARVQRVGVASVRGHVTWLACSAAPVP